MIAAAEFPMRADANERKSIRLDWTPERASSIENLFYRWQDWKFAGLGNKFPFAVAFACSALASEDSTQANLLSEMGFRLQRTKLAFDGFRSLYLTVVDAEIDRRVLGHDALEGFQSLFESHGFSWIAIQSLLQYVRKVESVFEG